MNTVSRLTTACETGTHKSCPERCLGNDASTSTRNFAGETIRIVCSCPCHRNEPIPEILPYEIVYRVQDRELRKVVHALVCEYVVNLDYDAIDLAEKVAAWRQKTWKHLGEARGHDPAEGLATHRKGAFSELAAAILTGKKWFACVSVPRGKPKPPDVGDLEIRCTMHRHGGLVLNEKDREAIYLLAWWLPEGKQTIRFTHWSHSANLKSPSYWREINDRPGCYIIPQAALKPIETLQREG